MCLCVGIWNHQLIIFQERTSIYVKKEEEEEETYQSICNLIFHGALTPMISFPHFLHISLFLSVRQAAHRVPHNRAQDRRDREHEKVTSFPRYWSILLSCKNRSKLRTSRPTSREWRDMYRAIKYCRILYAFYWRFAIYSHVRTKCIFHLPPLPPCLLSPRFPCFTRLQEFCFPFKNSSQYDAFIHFFNAVFLFIMTNLEMHFLSSRFSTRLDAISFLEELNCIEWNKITCNLITTKRDIHLICSSMLLLCCESKIRAKERERDGKKGRNAITGLRNWSQSDLNSFLLHKQMHFLLCYCIK